MSKINTENNEPANNTEKSLGLDMLFGFFILSLIASATIFLHHISVN